MGNYPWRRINYTLVSGMKMWRENGNTTTLLFSLKGLEILHQERRGQVKTIAMEHFNGILFHKSRSANKQHTTHPSLFPPHTLDHHPTALTPLLTSLPTRHVWVWFLRVSERLNALNVQLSNVSKTCPETCALFISKAILFLLLFYIHFIALPFPYS